MSNNSFEDLFDSPSEQSEPQDSSQQPGEESVSLDAGKSEDRRPINDPPRTTAELIHLKNAEDDFHFLVNKCQKTLEQLPYQTSEDFVKCRMDLQQKRIDFEESPSPFELSRQLAMVQVMKDEMLKIYADAHLTYTIRQRVYDTLTDAYCVVSQAKTADKRKGEAAIALSAFAILNAEAEAFYDYCKKIVENLESQYKMISRRIFCMEMQLTLGELSTAPSSEDLDKSKKRLIRDILDERKKIDSEPHSVEWNQ